MRDRWIDRKTHRYVDRHIDTQIEPLLMRCLYLPVLIYVYWFKERESCMWFLVVLEKYLENIFDIWILRIFFLFQTK